MIVSICSAQGLVAGTFSPATLAKETFTASLPGRWSCRHLPYRHFTAAAIIRVGPLRLEICSPITPASAKRWAVKNRMVYVQPDNTEHVVTYSPIPMAGMDDAIQTKPGKRLS